MPSISMCSAFSRAIVSLDFEHSAYGTEAVLFEIAERVRRDAAAFRIVSAIEPYLATRRRLVHRGLDALHVLGHLDRTAIA